MRRVIVNIVSAQTIPNYIFIRQMFQIGDELLFISSKEMKDKIGPIVETLGWKNVNVESIILANKNDEEKWNEMASQIKKRLTSDSKYIVNLTGGTKYMSLAVQRIFEEFNSEFFYITFPKNHILPLMSDSDSPIPIDYRISVDEYMRVHNIKTSKKGITQDKDYTKTFFTLFSAPKLNDADFEIIDKLRAYRNGYKKKDIDILEIEKIEDNAHRYPKIENLQSFLDKIEFPQTGGILSKYEVQYLTGGWFEEYVYHLIADKLHPTDMQIGVEIKKTDTTNMNDLDVVFTKGNKLFVIECKTGIGQKALFNQVIYKASALKGYLLGLPANSYLFSLTGEDAEAEQASKNMGITYIHKSYFLKEEKINQLVDSIVNTAN